MAQSPDVSSKDLCKKKQVSLSAHFFVNERNEPILRFQFSNASEDSILIYESALPWGMKDSVTLTLASPKNYFVPKEEDHVLDTPGFKQVEIKAGESLAGDIFLGTRFPKFSALHAHTDLVVYWYYDASLDPRLKIEPCIGGILIKRSEPDKPTKAR